MVTYICFQCLSSALLNLIWHNQLRSPQIPVGTFDDGTYTHTHRKFPYTNQKTKLIEKKIDSAFSPSDVMINIRWSFVVNMVVHYYTYRGINFVGFNFHAVYIILD